MKKLVVVFAAMIIQLSLHAQDCTIYFPQKEGTVLEVTDYNPKGKENSHATTTITKREVSGGDIIISASMETETDGEPFSMDYTASCVDGVFSINLFTGMNTAGMNHVEMDGDFLDIPSNPSAGQMLDDKSITVKFVGEDGTTSPLLNLRYQFTNRKVEALEKLTTKAGTFDTIKLSYTITFKMVMNISFNVVEWYAKDVGLVKSETYTTKGKLKSYTELTKISN